MTQPLDALNSRPLTVFVGVFWLISIPALAELPTVKPVVDAERLPRIVDRDTDYNPYRGNLDAIAIGREAFNQACATCHGLDADGSRMPAPDLRRIGRSCTRLVPGDWKRRCESDADHYFKHSVEAGKVKVGIRHMPAWKGILSVELIWAIRTFAESARQPPGEE